MFKSINKLNDKKLKKEKENMYKEYIKNLQKKSIDFDFNINHEENKNMYKKMKENLKINLIFNIEYEKINEFINMEEIKENKNLFFAYLERSIRNLKFIKAKKMINYAKFRKYFCKQFYDIKRFYKRMLKKYI